MKLAKFEILTAMPTVSSTLDTMNLAHSVMSYRVLFLSTLPFYTTSAISHLRLSGFCSTKVTHCAFIQVRGWVTVAIFVD